MAKQDFRNVPVKPDTKERLDAFRKSGMGTVSHDDALKALLDFWEKNHK